MNKLQLMNEQENIKQQLEYYKNKYAKEHNRKKKLNKIKKNNKKTIKKLSKQLKQIKTKYKKYKSAMYLKENDYF